MTLTVELVGEAPQTIREGESLSFGRQADLIVDTNRHLHRKVGVFHHERGMWWLTNVGSMVVVDLFDMETRSRVTVQPGASTPIAFSRFLVQFAAGVSAYQLDVVIEGVDAVEVAAAPPTGTTEGTITVGASEVPLTIDQKRFLVALAEPRLQDPSLPASSVPSNAEGARRLGWTTKRYERKLSNVCEKFHEAGVAGLKGDLGGSAQERRENLVEFVIASGTITVADLPLLDEDPEDE